MNFLLMYTYQSIHSIMTYKLQIEIKVLNTGIDNNIITMVIGVKLKN